MRKGLKALHRKKREQAEQQQMLAEVADSFQAASEGGQP